MKNSKYVLSDQILLGQYNNNNIFAHFIKTDELTNEPIKLMENDVGQTRQENIKAVTIH